MNDITAVKRDGALGDGFTYDLNQQIIGYRQNGTVNLGAGTVTGGTLNSLAFDGCGNMKSKNDAPYLPANNMNQPTDPGVTYDLNGNLKTYAGYVYNYDAQNRLRTVLNTNNVTVAQFWYDGLNRQVARSTTAVTIPNLPVTTSTFSVWDGDWAILEEYGTDNTLIQSFVQGAHGLVKTLPNNIYYYQESLGSTSHVANSVGTLVEYYKYDLYGKPTYWSPTNSQLPSSNFGIQDLHGGQRWIPELGLYDDRNRFMSPELGRFLQPDPIGFKGDSSNLYRYCGNDWANRTDPMGLQEGTPMHDQTARENTMNKQDTPPELVGTFNVSQPIKGSNTKINIRVEVWKQSERVEYCLSEPKPGSNIRTKSTRGVNNEPVAALTTRKGTAVEAIGSNYLLRYDLRVQYSTKACASLQEWANQHEPERAQFFHDTLRSNYEPYAARLGRAVYPPTGGGASLLAEAKSVYREIADRGQQKFDGLKSPRLFGKQTKLPVHFNCDEY